VNPPVTSPLPSDPTEVFVFAGAGLSMSAPTALPLFDWLRDTLLQALKFDQYVPDEGMLTAEQRRVKGIQPEPFFCALENAGVDTQSWLARVLDPPNAEPNAAHRAVAALCLAGSRVWTVNFDAFIERALPGIKVIAAPEEPRPRGRPGELLKPHGTIGGRLVVTPRETLTAPPNAWQARLRDDLSHCQHVVFIGYSGRDFDYRHLWNRVLTHHTVWWFDLPGRDLAYKRHLLRDTDAQHRLLFPSPDAHHTPDGHEFFNPAWEFVRWCNDNRLVDARTAERNSLLADRCPAPVPAPPTGTTIARADVAALLGDLSTSQDLLRQARWDPALRDEARTRLRTMFLNTPSWQARWATSLWWAIPPAKDLARARRRVRDKHLTQLSNHTDHRKVIALTDQLISRDRLSDAAEGLRLAALKMQGDIPDVIAQARRAVLEPRSDDNAVRCSAALHWCHALLWAANYRDLRQALDDHFRPLAKITNTRWMAWADYIEACLLIADVPLDDDVASRADAVTELLDAAEDRFRAEANESGLVDILTVRLTALRQQKQIQRYAETAHVLLETHRVEPLAVFAAQAAVLEIAQMYGYHLGDKSRALQIVEPLQRSQFPVHAALALVLSGQWTPVGTASDRLLRDAIGTAQFSGLDGIAKFADDMSELDAEQRSIRELFFP
jgi:hypothetical protein